MPLTPLKGIKPERNHTLFPADTMRLHSLLKPKQAVIHIAPYTLPANGEAGVGDFFPDTVRHLIRRITQ